MLEAAGEAGLYFTYNFAYLGKKGEQLVANCIRKVRRSFKETASVKVVVLYQVTKLSFFYQHEAPPLSKSFVVNDFKCPGCGLSYIGKTNRTLRERLLEHASDSNSVVKELV